MLLLWHEEHRLLEGRPRIRVLFGIGVGFAGTPASHSLTGVGPREACGDGLGDRGPSSATSGGAIMQSILGAAPDPRAMPLPSAPRRSRPRPTIGEISDSRRKPADEVLSRSAEGPPRIISIRSTRPRSPPAPRSRSLPAPSGRTRPASWRSCSARWSSSCSSSRSTRTSNGCLPGTTPRTPAPPNSPSDRRSMLSVVRRRRHRCSSG